MKAVDGWGMAVFIAGPWQAGGHALPGRAHPRRSRSARTGAQDLRATTLTVPVVYRDSPAIRIPALEIPMTRTPLLLALGLVPILPPPPAMLPIRRQRCADRHSGLCRHRPAPVQRHRSQPLRPALGDDLPARRQPAGHRKRGKLQHLDPASGQKHDITGVPKVAYAGQGGFGDIILHPDFARNHVVYVSYAEEGTLDTRGAAVAGPRWHWMPTAVAS